MEVANPGRRQRPYRPCADRVHPDARAAQVGRQVAHRRLQRRLRHAHHVVVWRPAFGADIGQRQQAAARPHHRHRPLRNGDERVAGDIQRLQRTPRAACRGSGRAGRSCPRRRWRGPGNPAHPTARAMRRTPRRRWPRRRRRTWNSASAEPTDAASGRTRRPSASTWYVNASSAPWAAQAAAMPQPSERSLVTPMIRPRLPCISVPWTGAVGHD